MTVAFHTGATPIGGPFAAWLAANEARWDAPRMPRRGSSWLITERLPGPVGRPQDGDFRDGLLRIHGFRSLAAVRQEGFGVRSYVLVGGGKKREVIDSHVLFRLPSGKLLSVPTMALVGGKR